MNRIIIAIAVLMLTAGCKTYKQYSRPDDVIADNLFGEGVAADDTATIASIPWREFFTDSYLQELIETGLVNNADLRIASLRVAEAEATLSAARLAYLPSVTLNPQGSISSFGGEKAVKTYNLGLSADWELDIAGRITNEKRGAFADLQRQESYRRAVSTQLVATIANTYYNLLTLDRQIAISRESLGAWDEIIRTLEAKKKVGESNEAAVAQSKASRYEVEISILSLTNQVSVMENSLCSLLDITPRPIARGQLEEQRFPDSLSVGVPLQMLENRPDIREAEYALKSTFYSVNVARSAFYPSLTLSGTIGWTNNGGASIVNPGKWLANAIGSLTQPIFNRGRNKANLEIARARHEEALIDFRHKLIEAGAEVNNALSQWQNARARIAVSHSQIAELENAVRSTMLLMTYSDTGNYLEVLTARQTLLSAQLDETRQQFDKIQGVINLYHALGGGD